MHFPLKHHPLLYSNVGSHSKKCRCIKKPLEYINVHVIELCYFGCKHTLISTVIVAVLMAMYSPSSCLHSQKVKADFEAPIPKMSDFCTTTRADFCANGFVPAAPQPTQVSPFTFHTVPTWQIQTVGEKENQSHSTVGLTEHYCFQGLDYRTDQAITFWSENYHLIEVGGSHTVYRT